MDKHQIDALFNLYEITDPRDAAAFQFFIRTVMGFQLMFGVTDTKIRKYMSMTVDFLEMEMETKK